MTGIKRQSADPLTHGNQTGHQPPSLISFQEPSTYVLITKLISSSFVCRGGALPEAKVDLAN